MRVIMSLRPGGRAVVAVVLLAAGLASGIVASQRSPGSMVTAANRFLGGLTPEQRPRAALPYDGDERMRWHYVPTEQFPRQGVPIKEMTEPQRTLAHDLLKSGLSQRGYATATAIMALESILSDIENSGGRKGRFARDPEVYFFTVFGTPSAKGTWGWRVEGHHLSLHFDVSNGTTVASSPTFFGTNPAEVREGPRKGLRLLADEEDSARALLAALNESQRKTAIMADVAPNEMVTANSAKVDPLAPAGLLAAEMNEQQRAVLMQLIQVYTSKMADDLAAERIAKLKKAGLDTIRFAWAGETDRGKKHYYRVQGPTFLIEYDNAQNDGNHIHSVWRDFAGDFGRDLLREHVTAVRH
jgi:Protein of unknown function (DUF3500)